jgi:hypothetical protein
MVIELWPIRTISTMTWKTLWRARTRDEVVQQPLVRNTSQGAFRNLHSGRAVGPKTDRDLWESHISLVSCN